MGIIMEADMRKQSSNNLLVPTDWPLTKYDEQPSNPCRLVADYLHENTHFDMAH